MFGNNTTDDFEDEEALDPNYKPPQPVETLQAFPTVAQPTPPNNYPFAAPPQSTWQQLPTAAPAAQPLAQPVAHASPVQSQSVSGPGRRIPAAWGGAAPTLAPASTALPTAKPVPHQTPPAIRPVTTTPSQQQQQQQPSPFIPIAAAYTPNTVTSTNSAMPAMHMSHPVREGSVALPTPITSAINVSAYKGPSAFSNGESYFDDED